MDGSKIAPSRGNGRAQHMRCVHEQRRRQTERRVMRALSLIQEEGGRVTFSLVSRVSGVSRPTLYNTPKLNRAVKGLIERQCDARANMASARDADAETIARLRREVGRLQGKVRRQADMIEVLCDRGPVLRDEDLAGRL